MMEPCSFVGLGEDPEILAYRAPALFEVRGSIYCLSALSPHNLHLKLIRETYPQVVQGVRYP